MWCVLQISGQVRAQARVPYGFRHGNAQLPQDGQREVFRGRRQRCSSKRESEGKSWPGRTGSPRRHAAHKSTIALALRSMAAAPLRPCWACSSHVRRQAPLCSSNSASQRHGTCSLAHARQHERTSSQGSCLSEGLDRQLRKNKCAAAPLCAALEIVCAPRTWPRRSTKLVTALTWRGLPKSAGRLGLRLRACLATCRCLVS